MNTLFTNLDATEAWLPVDVDGATWNRVTAAHFYRRAGFGATLAQLDEALKRSPSELVDELLVESPEFLQELKAIERTVLAGREAQRLPAYWLYRMLLSPAQLLEKLTLFWHGHFATSAEKVTDVKAMWAQNRLLRQCAAGSFRKLVVGISKDPAMLVYLDSTANRKTHPNENYARELLELFCLGLGNYTEKDIQQLARCFTGWEVRRGRFRFNRYQHDRGTKTLFGKTAELDGEAAIELVLQQPACPKFVVKKLLRFFVADEIEWPEAYLRPLVDELLLADYELKPVVRRILTSRVMFSPEVVGAKVRSPIELAVGFLRCFGATTDLNRLSDRLRGMGQLPYFPPNVKGWDGGRKWINTSTVLARANLLDGFLFDEQTQWKDGDLSAWVSKHNVTSAEDAIDRFSQLLFAVPPNDEARRKAADGVTDLDIKNHQSIARLLHTLTVLPAFQLG